MSKSVRAEKRVGVLGDRSQATEKNPVEFPCGAAGQCPAKRSGMNAFFSIVNCADLSRRIAPVIRAVHRRFHRCIRRRHPLHSSPVPAVGETHDADTGTVAAHRVHRLLGLPRAAVTPTAQLLAHGDGGLWFEPGEPIAVWHGFPGPHGFPAASLAEALPCVEQGA